MFTFENFLIGLKKVMPNIEITISDDSLLLTKTPRLIRDTPELNDSFGEIPLIEIKQVIDDIDAETAFIDYHYYKKTSVEVPISLHDRMRLFPFGSFERERFSVSAQGHAFVISKASVQYVMALLCFSSIHTDISLRIYPLQHASFTDNQVKRVEDLCDLFRIHTAKITAPVECSLSAYKRMLQSYLFNIAYNSNIVFSVSDFAEDRRPLRRNERREGQLFPYMQYNYELAQYYYQGVSTDIPFTQYLAFYHVAEFFFQTISEDEAFQEIEELITRPSFSPHRKDDIKVFYGRIKKTLRTQREDGVWDERIGLLLCLKKHVPDIQNLMIAINAIDASALDYYRTNDAPFADEGKTINFEDSPDEVYVAIRNRVYSVRNAIVHSKEGEKPRYMPFKHDKVLAREIPLIRAIAEEIIISSAKPMEIKGI